MLWFTYVFLIEFVSRNLFISLKLQRSKLINNIYHQIYIVQLINIMLNLLNLYILGLKTIYKEQRKQVSKIHEELEQLVINN